MFEEKLNANQSSPQTPAFADKKPFGPPPINLPVDDYPSAGNKQPGREPEDILADIEVDKESVERPTKARDFGAPSMPAEAPAARAEAKEPFVTRYKKVFVLIFLILLGGAVLGGGGWYAYSQFFVKPNLLPEGDQGPAVNTNQPVVNQNVNINQDVNLNQNIDTNEPLVPVDTDRDGLTDQEEALYGTNPAKVDTDDDGLTDRDETKVFETDPINADTDGDGYLDGEEVRSGYDPKGSGRLLEID